MYRVNTRTVLLIDVPHFFAESAGVDRWTQSQWDAVREFAASHGHVATWIDPATEPEFTALLEASDLYYVAFGNSPNGLGHCCSDAQRRIRSLIPWADSF